MESFITEPTVEEKNISQASKLKKFRDPFDNSDPKICDLSLADSFLDFDSIKEFFEDNQDRISLEKIEVGVFEKSVKMGEEKTHFGDRILHGADPILDGSGCVVKVEALECEKEKDLSCRVEEVMDKVSLVGVKSDEDGSGKVGSGSDLVGGNGVKSEVASDENDSESDSESEDESLTSSSSSSSSGSSSDNDDAEEEEDEEEKEEVKTAVKRDVVVPGDLEEGEIEEMVGRNDDDGDEEYVVGRGDAELADIDMDENDVGAMEGPIKSKNELQVLPPVPQVNVTLQPHHQMLPVGVVLSVIGVQVIVEGVEKHNPLNEGSILWITESRSPLGLIDEIFGPVKNPYYVVRYNSETEIPAGVHVGSLISFVQEFANHVLNDKNLYKKGYDASGENDEELSDEAEFSDDEEEAEYRRKLKMEKRGMSDQKPGNGKNNRKKGKNRDGTWKNDRHSAPQMAGVGQQIPNQNQHHVFPNPASLDCGNCSSSGIVQGFVGGIGSVPQFPPMAQTAGFTSSNGVWTTGMPSQQLRNTVFPNGFLTNSMPWPSQNYQQPPFQPMMNDAAILQQFNPSQTLPGGQPNFFAGPTYAPWPGFMGQNSLNQMIGVGFPGQPAHPSVNVGELAIPPNGEQNTFQAAGVLPESIEASKEFNMGASSNRGRKQYHRGGGRFASGRGRQQSR